jgi:hypothetical protein
MFARLAMIAASMSAALCVSAPAAAQSESEKARILEVLEQLKAEKDIGVAVRNGSGEAASDIVLAQTSARNCALSKYPFMPLLSSEDDVSDVALTLECKAEQRQYGMVFSFKNSVLSYVELHPGGVAFAAPPAPRIVEPDHSKPSIAMQGFLNEVASGDTAAARARIARIESITGNSDDLLDLTADQVVERLSACEMDQYSSRGSQVFRTESTVWKCGEGETLYVTFVGERDANNPYLSIVGLQDEAKKAAFDARPKMALAPPRAIERKPLTEAEVAAEQEQKRLLREKEVVIRDAFGSALIKGDLAPIKDSLSDKVRVVYQTRDPFFSTDIVVQQGQGPEALDQIVAFAKDDVGKPKTVECSREDREYAPHICRWKMPRQDRSMFAFINFWDGQINSVQLFYAKREEVLGMRQRAIKAGKIDG